MVEEDKDKLIEKLILQLQEKEKEVEKLKDNWNVLCDYLGDCIVQYDKEDVNGIYSEVLDKVNILKRYDYKRYQSKIEFAIQQLQRVKEEYYAMYGIELVGFIDQIIKELEGVK